MAIRYRCAGYQRGVCEYTSDRPWRGRCPSCGRLYDCKVVGREGDEEDNLSFAEMSQMKATHRRLPSGVKEFDSVIGGGVVPGMVLLLGGPPKTGKTTLLVPVSAGVGDHGDVWYVSGEMSREDMIPFIARCGVTDAHNVRLLGNTGDCDVIKEKVTERRKPKLVIIDSIQTAYFNDVKADAGSPAQIKAVANSMTEWAKERKIALIFVGHIDKQGELAGPMFAKHIVDAVVMFEPAYEFHDDGSVKMDTENRRILSCSENRFASGPGTFSSLFEMTERGVRPIRKKSKLELVTATGRRREEEDELT